MQWFDHSSTAASDDAIMALRMEHPDSAAVDCYWAIVEKQFHDERSVPFSETNRETKALAHRLYVGFESVSKYVETMLEVGLLKRDENGDLYSERAKEAIEKYQLKCETARQNGKRGGRKPSRKPNAKPTTKPTEKPSRSNRKENNTGIGLDKTKPIPCGASCVADAEETASHSAHESTKPICPLCESPVRFDAKSMKWKCQTCGEINEPRYVDVVA